MYLYYRYIMFFCTTIIFSISAEYSIDKKFLKKILSEDPIIVDAGAYDGTDTAELASVFPKGRIYAFEPVPSVFAKLKTKVSNFKNIVCFSCALGEKSGEVDLFVSGGHYNGAPHALADASSSLLQPKIHLELCPGITFKEKITVPVVTLDEWMHTQNLSKIDFLWFDLQGYEYKVLKASPIALKSIQAIYTEVNLKELYEGCVLYVDFKKFLEEEGFCVVWESDILYQQKNVLFVRSKSPVEKKEQRKAYPRRSNRHRS